MYLITIYNTKPIGFSFTYSKLHCHSLSTQVCNILKKNIYSHTLLTYFIKFNFFAKSRKMEQKEVIRSHLFRLSIPPIPYSTIFSSMSLAFAMIQDTHLPEKSGIGWRISGFLRLSSDFPTASREMGYTFRLKKRAPSGTLCERSICTTQMLLFFILFY